MSKKIIAWDTSARVGTLVAIEDGALVGEYYTDVQAVHSEKLLWSIDHLLKKVGWTLEELTALGVGVGPGSFTGLRIGVTTARTLALSLDIPVVGVSSLFLLAQQAIRQVDPSTLVIVARDACKGELFTLWGARDECGLSSEQAVSPEDFVNRVLNELEKDPSRNWVEVGAGGKRYPDQWSRLPADRRFSIVSPQEGREVIAAEDLAGWVWRKWSAEGSQPPLEVHPNYLRASNAEVKLKAGELPPGPTRG